MFDTSIENKQDILVLLVASIILTSLKYYNYLLFHTFAEFFLAMITFSIFIFFIDTKNLSKSDYLYFISLGSLFISLTTILHTLGYKGMSLFLGYDANLPSQLRIVVLWYIETITFLFAIFFTRKYSPLFFSMLCVFFIISVLLILSRNFPDCYVEGNGFTKFKIVSEYIVIALQILVFILTVRQKFFTNYIRKLLFVGRVYLPWHFDAQWRSGLWKMGMACQRGVVCHLPLASVLGYSPNFDPGDYDLVVHQSL